MAATAVVGILEKLLEDKLSTALVVASITALYSVYVVIYRLYLSPIANVPGDILTIVTGWYEVYCDVWRGGQFTFKIEEWHRKYGPIIRINPWEVHIADTLFYEDLYTASSKFSKREHLRWRFGLENSTFDTVEHNLHGERRLPLNVFYSKQKVQQFSPYIHRCADKLIDRIQREFQGTGTVINMTEAWGAFTLDVTTMHAFALDYEFLDFPNFEAPFTRALFNLVASLHWMAHFPFIGYTLRALPEHWIAALHPDMKLVYDFQGEFYKQIRKVLKGDYQKTDTHKTVFHEIVNTKMSKKELTFERLKQEAAGLIGGGVETTRTALSWITYFILAHPEVEEKLRNELQEAIPDPTKIPSLLELEKLPYLTAITREGVRHSMGPCARQSRTNPYGPIQYGGYTIPTNTPFAMTPYLSLRDEKLYPEPLKFIPERWLETPTDGNSKYVLKPIPKGYQPFGKGPRWCLGMNLAVAELYIGIASFFRRLDNIKLHETGPEVVEIVSEYVVPIPKSEKGVRVTVG